MLNTSDATRKAFATMNEKFDALQAVQRKMQPMREADLPISIALHEEWEMAYQQFQAAHEQWKSLTAPVRKPSP